MDLLDLIPVVFPIVVGGLSLFFRRSWLLRIGCVGALLILSLVHWSYLSAGHRLIAEQLQSTTEEQTFDEATVNLGEVFSVVQKSIHRSIPLYESVVGTLAFLAILPVRKKSS